MKRQDWEHIAMKNMSNMCYMTDMDTNQILYINDAGKKLIGLSDESYIGEKCYKIIQGKDKVCSFCTNHKLVENEFYKWEYFNTRRQRYFELNDTMFKIDGRNIRYEIAIDVDVKNNKLIDLKEQFTLEATLLKCAKSLAVHGDMKTAINRLLKIIGEFYGAERSYIFEICEDEINIDNTYEWTKEGIAPQIENLQKVRKDTVEELFPYLELHGEFYICSLEDDVHFDSESYKILQPQGIESLLAAPLIIGKKIIGFVGLDNPQKKVDESVLLRSVSLFIESDLEKNRLVKELEKLSYLDIFTGLFNRNKYIQTLEEIYLSKSNAVGIIFLDINGLKKVNDAEGHGAGDRLILSITNMLGNIFSGKAFRIGGDEFVVLFDESNQVEFEKRILSLRNELNEHKEISLSLGASWCTNTDDIVKHIAMTDKLMYLDKEEHYKKGEIDGRKYRGDKVLMVEKQSF